MLPPIGIERSLRGSIPAVWGGFSGAVRGPEGLQSCLIYLRNRIVTAPWMAIEFKIAKDRESVILRVEEAPGAAQTHKMAGFRPLTKLKFPHKVQPQ